MAQYNFNNIIKGDTLRDTQFTITVNDVALDLTNYTIECKFRKGSKTGREVKSIDTTAGITKSDAVNGIFVIDAFDVDWSVATYYYDIEFTDGSDVITTYISGTMKVVQDVTY